MARRISGVGMFKLVDDGQYAERVNVMLGASSVNEIEVIEGLEEGDIVILSDMSNWDGFDRVRPEELMLCLRDNTRGWPAYRIWDRGIRNAAHCTS